MVCSHVHDTTLTERLTKLPIHVFCVLLRDYRRKYCMPGLNNNKCSTPYAGNCEQSPGRDCRRQGRQTILQLLRSGYDFECIATAAVSVRKTVSHEPEATH